jgi:16S rRNA (guanine(966)-N(2))-methyltransferase RsmD
LRETLFNVIAPRIEGSSFLDLCAGSGAVGIEALSRGATHSTFVDRSRKMGALVEANLDLCGIPADQTNVVQADADEFLRQAISRNLDSWDIVFFDPPYASDYLGILHLFGSNAAELLTEQGLLIVEHHHKNQLPDTVESIRRSRIIKQGDSSLSFYERQINN